MKHSFLRSLSGSIFVFAVAILSLTTLESLRSQVTLSPEIGLSYWPISTRSLTSGQIYTSRRLDYLIGMSGAVPFNEKWNLNMRIYYIKREDIKWSDSVFGSRGNEIKHSDINIDISAGYNVFKNVSFSAGPSIVRKLNSSVHSHWGSISGGLYTISHSIDRFFYGFNLASSIDIKKFIIRAEYARFFWDQDDPNWGYFWGGHRYNLVLSYPVFTGKKR
jgi:hypothetical protein